MATRYSTPGPLARMVLAGSNPVGSTIIVLLALACAPPAQADVTYVWSGGTASLNRCPDELTTCPPSGFAAPTATLVLDDSLTHLVRFQYDLGYDPAVVNWSKLSTAMDFDRFNTFVQCCSDGLGLFWTATPAGVTRLVWWPNWDSFLLSINDQGGWFYSNNPIFARGVNSPLDIGGSFGTFVTAVPEPGTWLLMLTGLTGLWLARRRALLLALLAFSGAASADLLSATDSNAGPVNEHRYLSTYYPCVRSPCQIERILQVNAVGPAQRVVLSVSLLQSPFTEDDPAFEAMTLRHGGREVSLEPGITQAALSGLPITITFDDNAASERPLFGFQQSGSWRPYDPMAVFIGQPAAGPWVLTVMEFHENAGFTRYLGATLQVWADPAPFVAPVVSVPEPATWAMMLAGLMGLWRLRVR